MNSKSDSIKWVDGNLLFRGYVRENVFLILIFLCVIIFTLIVYVTGPVYICTFLIIVIPFSIGLILFIIELIEDYKHAQLEKSVLKCEWCKSLFSHEIHKTVEKLLEKRGLMYNNKHQGYYGKGLIRDTLLPQENVIISFFGPKRNTTSILFTKQYPNWIGIGSTKPNDEESLLFVESLKSEILILMKKMPDTNNFCKQCEGAHNSICYGGKWFRRGYESDIIQILEKIDPFKDERTLHYLIRRKERLKDKKILKRSDYQDLINMVQNQ